MGLNSGMGIVEEEDELKFQSSIAGMIRKHCQWTLLVGMPRNISGVSGNMVMNAFKLVECTRLLE